ncbi:MAG: hypothetical protein Q8T11_14715 [Elusimicrobiota bacterium]|nr:hypothetical protein [Elusimicrobiota bacterium]
MSEAKEADSEDLRAVVRRIAVKVSGLESLLSEMARSETVRSAFDGIRARLDGFTKEILASRTQRTLQDKSVNDLRELVGKQELRLTRLENLGGKP